jgi:hypothetical protein
MRIISYHGNQKTKFQNLSESMSKHSAYEVVELKQEDHQEVDTILGGVYFFFHSCTIFVTPIIIYVPKYMSWPAWFPRPACWMGPGCKFFFEQILFITSVGLLTAVFNVIYLQSFWSCRDIRYWIIKSSERIIWAFWWYSFGLCRRMDWLVEVNVSEKRAASIFRAKSTYVRI